MMKKQEISLIVRVVLGLTFFIHRIGEIPRWY